MRRDHHERGAFFQRGRDGGQRGADARVVGDAPALAGHVEVGADEDALAADVDLRQPTKLHDGSLSFIYFAVARAAPTSANTTATSSIRLENPHSLSYHAHAFTSVPSETRVIVESKIELA